MKIKEIRNLTNDELNAKLVAIKSEMFNLRFQHATGNLANPMLLNSLKKDIAKIKTVLTERELNINTNSNEKAKAEGVDLEEYKKTLMAEVNKSMPAYSKVNVVEYMDQPFEKTPKMSIKRFMYK